MKDLLVTIVQSMFKYVLNPAIWSRVAADMNAQTAEPTTPSSAQRVNDSPFDANIRDINVSKALDLANQQMQFILEQKKVELSKLTPSGIEMLAVKESAENKSQSDSSPSTSSGIRTESADTSRSEILSISLGAETASLMSASNSFEAFQLDDIALSAKDQDSLISLHSTENSVSIGDNIPSEHTTTISSSNSNNNNKSVDESNDGTTSSDSDSVEILSISSSTASS